MDPDDLRISRYLLGLLSSEETDSVEERFVSDDAFFEAVQAAEDELIRDYVCGLLSGPERSRFAEVYLGNPHLRQKVSVTEAIRAQGVRTTGSSQLAASAPLVVRLQWFRFPVLALAGTLATIVVGIGVWYAARGLPGRKAQEPAEAQEHGRPIAPAPAVVSFLIAPGLPKGGTAVRHRFEVPSGLRVVNLQLEVASPAYYQSYRSELFILDQPGMRSVLTRQGLAAARHGGGWIVSLDLDASLLRDGDYIVRLTGLDGSGAYVDLPSYSLGLQMR